MEKVTEDRSHRSHDLNPRRHPIGPEHYVNPSKERPWRSYSTRMAMLSTSERMVVHDYARFLGGGDYANLGHFNGGSAILIARCLKEYGLSGKVYSVDINLKDNSVRNLEKYEVTDTVELCSGGTDHWAKELSDKTFNLVFIDADHSYAAVKRDLENWTPMIRVGGFVALHDTNQHFSHIAIEETVASWSNWKERKDLHIHRIRTFERVR